jgi:hypothetical protein
MKVVVDDDLQCQYCLQSGEMFVNSLYLILLLRNIRVLYYRLLP